MKRKIRPLGEITEDLEPLMFELVEQHKMQAHEVLGMILFWITSHYPDAVEVYEDGTSPILVYKPKEKK